MDSLKKHKRQYCRFREYHSLQDFINELSGPISDKQEHLAEAEFSPFGSRAPSMSKSFSCDNLDNVKETFNPTFGDSLNALFSEIKFSSPSHDAVAGSEIPAVSTTETKDNLLTDFNQILYSWLHEIQRLESAYRSDAVIKKYIFLILLRMLQDGLLSESEYNELKFTSDLFIKLHQLINMYIPSIHKKDMILNLLDLYEIKKIDRNSLVELLLTV